MLEHEVQNQFKVNFVGGDGFVPRKVARLQHNFDKHPLLSLAALEQLAERLHDKNPQQVRFVAKGVKLDSRFNTTPENPDNVSIEEVFKNIENPGSWIALWAIQSEPEYKKLLWDVINSIDSNWTDRDQGLFELNGYVFISSPPSITPFHVDSENNFLLQISGRKKFGVWQPHDESIVTNEAVEDWIVYRKLDKVKFKPEYMENAAVDDVLTAGDGIYMPSTAPHLTQADTDLATSDSPYSITLAVVFYTRNTRRMAYIYSANRLLRKFGFSPRPPYVNKVIDIVKYLIGRLMVFSQRALRLYSPPTGF